MMKIIYLIISLLYGIMAWQPALAGQETENLIEDVVDDFSLNHYINRPEVQQQIRWYRKNSQYLQKTLAQGSPYLFYIAQEIEKRHLPGELVFLPFIESAFDPYAHSFVGAAGLWQFMPQTAQEVNIKQNWWYDGRRDIVRSTEGALDYLTTLNKKFRGNWLLTIAAYNSGAGTVQRAIRRNRRLGKPTQFWDLNLPRETKNYVPRLLALSTLMEHPEKAHLKLSQFKSSPYFFPVDVGFQIDLAHAAQMANISLNELHALNPGYNHWTTDPDGPHQLLLPIDNIGLFDSNLYKTTGKHSKVLRHRVTANETLAALARRYYTTSETIKRINHLDTETIKAQTVLLIPRATHALLPHHRFTKSPAWQDLYVVKAGDSLSQIAHRKNVKLAELRETNHLRNDTIKVGQKLFIPRHARQYTVQNGDSLAKIAKHYHTTVAELKRMNALEKQRYIYPGQKLVIYLA